MNDYWIECIEIAFDDAGIEATKEQIEQVAGCVEGGHENYGQAMGYDMIPSQTSIELDKAKQNLKAEQNKIECPDCKGIGGFVIKGPHHSSLTDCSRCRGDGRIYTYPKPAV